ncbi:MAG: hypothetical protein ACRDX8_04435 [Acidimicrobiales bacterium]
MPEPRTKGVPKETQSEGGQLFVVTTRSRLHGAWLFPPMMIATVRVRRQLVADPTVVRWASIVAGPSEFWTITVWRSRHDMQEFMRSGAHEEIMWLFSRLLRSFWLMRWRPGVSETGSWKGVTFARPEVGLPAGSVQDERLAQALEHLPRLAAATGATGAACYEATAFARRRRAEVGEASGVIVYVSAPPHRLPAAWRAMRRLRAEARSAEGFVRAALGIGHVGEIYLLAVWRTRDGAQRLLESPDLESLTTRWPCWANELLPENEFGNWDGARLRRMRRRQVIRVPPGAMAAAEADDHGCQAADGPEPGLA